MKDKNLEIPKNLHYEKFCGKLFLPNCHCVFFQRGKKYVSPNGSMPLPKLYKNLSAVRESSSICFYILYVYLQRSLKFCLLRKNT